MSLTEGEEGVESAEGISEAAGVGERAQREKASEHDAEMHASSRESAGESERRADETDARRWSWMGQHQVFAQLRHFSLGL